MVVMVSWRSLSGFFIVLHSCFFCFDARNSLKPQRKEGFPRLPRSQTVPSWQVIQSPKQFRYWLPRFQQFRRSQDPRQTWPGGMLQLKYPYPYQKFINQPLSYTKRNNLLSRAYQLSSWNNIPVNADIPSVAPVARLWQSVKSLITPLQRTATSRSNVDEDQSAVERRIQEYYDQRLNKKRNKWMFKPINGTTPHLKQIFIGRCWDFVTTKRKNLQDPDKLDCQEMWKVFSKSFAFKGPCDVTYDDYTPFFNLYKEKLLNNRVLFWSGTRELTHAYSRLYDKFTTLEDTLAGFLMNGLTWCGKKEGSGIDYKSCPYECSKQKPFWGQAAAKLAERARGVVHVMLNGTRQHFLDKQIFPTFMDDSYLAEQQLPSLPIPGVTEFRILVGHSLHHKSLERCDSLTVLELENRAKARGLKTTCFDNPYFIRHLLCLDNPADPLCLFKIPDQNTLI